MRRASLRYFLTVCIDQGDMAVAVAVARSTGSAAGEELANAFDCSRRT